MPVVGHVFGFYGIFVPFGSGGSPGLVDCEEVVFRLYHRY